jgi:aspartyl-tRNA(Asn)/glutamyl-tRNA(Gln) amidotransferase subunit C
MARVTAETVDHVARLAHLSLTEEERETFARQLDQILQYVESIQSLDTADVPPMSHALATGGFRPDVPGESLEPERALDQAPDPAEGLFRVPRIIGG